MCAIHNSKITVTFNNRLYQKNFLKISITIAVTITVTITVTLEQCNQHTILLEYLQSLSLRVYTAPTISAHLPFARVDTPYGKNLALL
jgi:hypothetical protein